MNDLRLYTRPGCGFSMHLQFQMDRRGITYDAINIWDNPDAAATVRKAANGNETVPTVEIGTRLLVNPSIEQVVAALDAAGRQSD